MNWVVIEEQQDKESIKHAGGKAREDLNSILLSMGLQELRIVGPKKNRAAATPLSRAAYHIQFADIWSKALRKVKDGDTIIMQFPVINDTILLSRIIRSIKKKNVKVCVFIHDLETIRMANDTNLSPLARWRLKREELDGLRQFDRIIVHNQFMKDFLHSELLISNDKMIPLEIFDYLIPDTGAVLKECSNYRSCIIAGNLNRNKAGYVYRLPEEPTFELYGINYDGESASNVHYHGAFPADELPCHLEGGFGLVWDGDSAETCNGVWGNYLKYNNPHKTSLYLAAGFPVAIWKESAMANFIVSRNLGIAVNSLIELDSVLTQMSKEEYDVLKENALAISENLRTGYFTKQALNKALESI